MLCGAVRALKMHGGGPPVTAGTPLAPEYKEENVGLVEKGVCNLVKHIQNTAQYGVPVLVAINKFASDTVAEMEIIRKASIAAGPIYSLHTCGAEQSLG
jgi:formyltetrahydrofolate synthetase